MKLTTYFEITKIKNLTTDINMFNSASSDKPQVVSYGIDHVSFEVDKKTCRKGQLVSIDGIVSIEGKTLDFNASGKISEIHSAEENNVKVVLELHQYDKVVWKKFVDHMKLRQGNIDKIFKSIREDD
jgi:hypothetical protein